jgi:hypothetical protein
VKRASERVVRAAPTFRQHARRGGSVFGRSLVSSSRLSGFHLFWYSCLGRCCSLLSSVFWLFVKHDRDILRWMQRRAVPPADTAPNGSFFCSWILFPASLDLVQLRLGACTTSSRPACSWVQLVGLVNLLPHGGWLCGGVESGREKREARVSVQGMALASWFLIHMTKQASALFVLSPGCRSSDVVLSDGLSGNFSRQIMPCVFHAARRSGKPHFLGLSLWDAVNVPYLWQTVWHSPVP